MAEWCHDFRHGEGVAYLINHPEECSDFRYIGWCLEVFDGFEIVCRWTNTSFSDFQACEPYYILSKLEFVCIKYETSPTIGR